MAARTARRNFRLKMDESYTVNLEKYVPKTLKFEKATYQ